MPEVSLTASTRMSELVPPKNEGAESATFHLHQVELLVGVGVGDGVPSEAPRAVGAMPSRALHAIAWVQCEVSAQVINMQCVPGTEEQHVRSCVLLESKEGAFLRPNQPGIPKRKLGPDELQRLNAVLHLLNAIVTFHWLLADYAEHARFVEDEANFKVWARQHAELRQLCL